jgi:hypothetical protein
MCAANRWLDEAGAVAVAAALQGKLEMTGVTRSLALAPWRFGRPGLAAEMTRDRFANHVAQLVVIHRRSPRR